MFKFFARDSRGSLGIGVALGATAMIGAVSATLDYSRMTNSRAALSAAVDAAALAGAQAPANDMQTISRQVFDANFRERDPVTAFTTSVIKRGEDDAVRVEAVAYVKMTLTQAIGFTSAPVRAVSEVLAGNDSDVQIALVLDVTQSMAGTRITSLKAAATDMVNALYDKLKKANQVKMAVVPFSQYVNVGMGNRNQPWMDVPNDSTTTQQVCNQARDIIRTYNCRMEFHSWTHCVDGVCGTQTGTWEVCDHDYGPYYQNCFNQTTTLKWDGCVGSRNYPNNVRDDNYLINRAPGVMNVHCPVPLTPLTPSQSTVLTAINELQPVGNTYIPSGLTWGWAALSGNEPLVEPDAPGRKTTKYLILMTDGANSMSPTYPYHNDYNVPVADALTAELCTNIKASGVQIFTISFDVDNNIIKNQLRICASSPDKYFDAIGAVQLSEAFKGITGQLSQLRIAR
ncbi:MAG: VWA domain-containing protein [Beijerinckiaceae bacterium]|nr:VWA domain-containing protein [Beijerinckiaceae bacterium]